MNLQYAILGILTYFPINGYQLGKLFARAFNSFWNASLSQIYRELGVLEKKGLVKSSIEDQTDRPDKRVYSITETGRGTFETWLMEFPEQLSTPTRDEFALRIFFSGKLDRDQLITQFKRYIAEREAFTQTMSENKQMIMEIVTAYKTPSEKEDTGMRFVAKRAAMVNDTMLAWARECLEELEKQG